MIITHMIGTACPCIGRTVSNRILGDDIPVSQFGGTLAREDETTMDISRVQHHYYCRFESAA